MKKKTILTKTNFFIVKTQWVSFQGNNSYQSCLSKTNQVANYPCMTWTENVGEIDVRLENKNNNNKRKKKTKTKKAGQSR